MLMSTISSFNILPNKLTVFKKDTLAEVFSYEFYEIFQSNLFAEHFRMTALKDYRSDQK